jgi:hypothetical protein
MYLNNSSILFRFAYWEVRQLTSKSSKTVSKVIIKIVRHRGWRVDIIVWSSIRRVRPKWRINVRMAFSCDTYLIYDLLLFHHILVYFLNCIVYIILYMILEYFLLFIQLFWIHFLSFFMFFLLNNLFFLWITFNDFTWFWFLFWLLFYPLQLFTLTFLKHLLSMFY